MSTLLLKSVFFRRLCKLDFESSNYLLIIRTFSLLCTNLYHYGTHNRLTILASCHYKNHTKSGVTVSLSLAVQQIQRSIYRPSVQSLVDYPASGSSQAPVSRRYYGSQTRLYSHYETFFHICHCCYCFYNYCFCHYDS